MSRLLDRLVECRHRRSKAEVQEAVFEQGTGFTPGLVDLLRQADPGIVAQVAGVSVADVRAASSAPAIRGLFGGDPARAWTAVVMDPALITLEPQLLATAGVKKGAARQVIAEKLGKEIARTPFIAGASAKADEALGMLQVAQTYAHRANSDLVTRRAVVAAQESIEGLVKEYAKELDELLAEMEALMKGARTAAQRQAVETRIRGRLGVMRARIQGLRATTADFSERMAGDLDDASRNAFEDGVRRSIDRLWDQTAPGNTVAAEKAVTSRARAETVRVRLGREFFRTNAETLKFAVGNHPKLAGRVAAQAANGIAEAVTRTAILRGENSRFLAREIRKEWGDALEGIRLSAGARARFIARTETAKVHAEADKAAQARLGVRFVEVYYSAGAFPCQICPDIASGGPYQISPLDQVPEGGIPFHPNCRCSYAPFIPPGGLGPVLFHEGENHEAGGLVMANQGGRTHALLTRRPDGALAIPAGFVPNNEAGEAAARKLAVGDLRAETGLPLAGRPVQIAHARGPGRDPRDSTRSHGSMRGFLFSLGALAVLPRVRGQDDDPVAAKWVPVDDALEDEMYADHARILREARLRNEG